MRAVAEATAAAAVIGAFAKIVPAIAACFAIAWYCVCLWESATGRRWRDRWRALLVRRTLSFEDRMAFLFLILAGSGAAGAVFALGRLLP